MTEGGADSLAASCLMAVRPQTIEGVYSPALRDMPWRQVAVIVDPADYEQLLSSLQQGGGPDAQMRARLAWKAFQHTATYDATVAEWLWNQIGAPPPCIPPWLVAGRDTPSSPNISTVHFHQG